MNALTLNWWAQRSKVAAKARRWLGVISAASSSSSGSNTTGHLLYGFFICRASQAGKDMGCLSEYCE